MEENCRATIDFIPHTSLVKILEQLSVLDQHEAGMVNKSWFNAVYRNPRNTGVLSLNFGNVLLDDLEPPLSYFRHSTIPYTRLVLSGGIHLGTVDQFFAKIGETLEDLVIRHFVLKKKYEKYAFSAGRLADILENMQKLRSLEICWSFQTEFMNGNTVFQRQNGEKVLKALENVREFRLIARDVTAEQFLSLVTPMKHLESLYVDIKYTTAFLQQDGKKAADWFVILQIIKEHASTLRHLFLNLCSIDAQQEVPLNKKEFLTQLQRIRALELESFSLNLAYDLSNNFLYQFFHKFSSTFTTLGPVPKNDVPTQPMEITPANLGIIVQTLPRLRFINVKVTRPLKDLTIFNHLLELRVLNLNVHTFDRSHHLFHRQSQDLPFKKPAINPKMKHLVINGASNHYAHRVLCIKCVMYMTIIFPNVTRLELNVNVEEGLNDQAMRLIFHHLTNLEVLGANNCKELTDDGFTGTFTKNENFTIIKKRHENFSIGNLKKLRTVLLYPLDYITDATFIDGISKITGLKRIAMTGLEEITATGIEALADGCPNLEVIFFENCTQFDERFVKFLLARMIHLKYMKLGTSMYFPDEIINIPGIELLSDRVTGERTVVWRAHNFYKCGTGQFPLNVLNLQL
ncbi:uncharacterized protein LOC134828186 [Culicoides brevitarsis]|uniref:uncharacterized protein LOC134828186 n=1 Tax=Culicoides brevitarsis TaxID=469753 RepID=UPI00307CA81C